MPSAQIHVIVGRKTGMVIRLPLTINLTVNAYNKVMHTMKLSLSLVAIQKNEYWSQRVSEN